MSDELQTIAAKLGLEKYRRHIFLCTDAAEPKCAPREATLRSWEFLKARLKELKLTEPNSLVYRTKANCLRVCVDGPVAVVYPEGVWYDGCCIKWYLLN
ncbi:MAG: (2Fe-2S) ferredoxin domain-containing protein [Verrucomicrobia bacterium]|nr:(2Fe-2S) ferredoxin domain-containing protein [Verrucomicrobiota bacterium]